MAESTEFKERLERLEKGLFALKGGFLANADRWLGRILKPSTPTTKQVYAWNATTNRFELASGAQALFCRATANLTLTISYQSITGDGDTTKVRLLLPTIGEWLVKADCDLGQTGANSPGNLSGALFVNDSGTPETGNAVFVPRANGGRSTSPAQWKITTTAANTPIELKAKMSTAGGDALCRTEHTTLSATIGLGGGYAVETSDHGTLTGLGDDDHTQYQKESEKNAASGYAGLTAGTKINLAQMQEVMAHADLTDSPAAAHHALVTLAADAAVLLDLTGQQLSLDAQAANLIFGGPASGAAADPTFRALVDADIPAAIARDAEVTAALAAYVGSANVVTVGALASGSLAATFDDVPVAVGGTGASTAQAAINTLTAVAGATNEHVLTKDTATGNAIFKAAAGGGGGGTLDAAYDFGGAGAGRIITADTGAVELRHNANTALLATRDSGGADTADRFSLSRDGAMSWGSGAAAVDIVLSRAAAHQLALAAGDSLRVQYIKDTAGTTRITTAAALPHVTLTGDVVVTHNLGVRTTPPADDSAIVSINPAFTHSTAWGSVDVLKVSPTITTTVTGWYSAVAGIFNVNITAAATAYIYGLNFAAQARSTSAHANTAAEVFGIIAGYGALRTAGTLAVTAAAGIKINSPTVTGAADITITTSYGIWILTPSAASLAGLTNVYSLKLEDIAHGTNRYLLEAGPATPYLRLIGGAAPAANQTNLYLAEGVTPTLRRVQWKLYSALVAADKVMVLV